MCTFVVFDKFIEFDFLLPIDLLERIMVGGDGGGGGGGGEYGTNCLKKEHVNMLINKL